MSMIMDSRSSQERESLATTTIFFEGKNCTDDVEIYPSKLTCDDWRDGRFVSTSFSP